MANMFFIGLVTFEYPYYNQAHCQTERCKDSEKRKKRYWVRDVMIVLYA